MFGKGKKFPVEGRTVLITGGSQGLGRAAAKVLSSKGANVVIVARNIAKLEDAIRYIASAARDSAKQRFHHISADVSSPSENERIIAETQAWNNGRLPDVVWANAGHAVPGLFLETSVETLRAQMDINYFGAAFLAHATLRKWLTLDSGSTQQSNGSDAAPKSKPEPRHFIMTSSTAAFVGVAGYTPYAPAKAALRSLHDSLRSELNIYHGALTAASAEVQASQPEVRLHTIFPGTILTPGFEEEQKIKHAVTKMLEEEDPPQKEDEVAEAAIAALEKGHALVTTQGLMGPVMKASAWQASPRDNWVLDTLMQWVMALVWLFVTPDLDGKVWKWGKKNGIPEHSKH